MEFTERDAERAYIKAGIPRRSAKVLAHQGFRAYLKLEGREDEIPQWEKELGIAPTPQASKPKVAPKAGGASQPRDRVTDLLSRAGMS